MDARRAIGSILSRLQIDDPRFVEIESKRRVVPEEAGELRRWLESRKGMRHLKSVMFFDQFVDTPDSALFRKGASLRLRYKRQGLHVYLQYKGPGFHSRGVLFRSEFSTGRLRHVLLEESHHDIVHFNDTTVQRILRDHVPEEMARAIRTHLGRGVLRRISRGPLIVAYTKDKFELEAGDARLEPSLDRIFAFHVGRGLHPLSTFCEYENEIKAEGNSLRTKLERLDELLDFDEKLVRRFDLPYERMDKYHRMGSFFIPNGAGRRSASGAPGAASSASGRRRAARRRRRAR